MKAYKDMTSLERARMAVINPQLLNVLRMVAMQEDMSTSPAPLTPHA